MYFNSTIEDNIEPQVAAVCNNAGVVAPEPTDDPVSRARQLLQLYHSMPNGLNFELTKELALDCVDEILEHWLPDGEQRGRQYVAYNPTRNDGELGSFSIKTESGLWSDFADDAKGGDLISLVRYVTGCEYQSEAAVKILEFIAGMKTDDGAPVAIRNAGHKAKAKQEFTAIMPVPENAKPRPVNFGAVLGKPVTTWEYRNAADQAMFYVSRFNTKPRKTMIPQTYGIDETGQASWRYKAPDAPRPAYGLNRLAARPDAPVLFTEGEKAADAGQRLFPDYVAVTTLGGAQAPEKTDFRPFAGRKVYIAPDNDEAGVIYKEKLIQLLRAVGAEVVAVMQLELLSKGDTPLAENYDLADAEADGWTADGLAELGTALWESLTIDIVQSTPEKRSSRVKKAEVKDETLLMKARRFAAETFDGQLAFTQNQFRTYSEGYWPELDQKVEVEREVLEFLGSKATPSSIGTITSLLSTAYAVKPTNFERLTPLICLQNGTLNPSTGELSEHAPEHYLTNKLDVAWNLEAVCPIWLQTLDEIFAPDADRAEKIQLLQEFMGYCLIPMTKMHKFLWMVGSGGNGKSLILEVLMALIGPKNISFAQIERLQEKFVRAELCGKLVNISSEMSAQATIADGYLKQIVAGDVIEAERKHQPSFSFKPYSRMIGATNELPRLLDHSDGFFRRAMILTFNKQFAEADQDKDRNVKLMKELPGILKWAVDGLQRLLERGKFAIPSSSVAEVSKYRISSDPIRQFVEECIVASGTRSDYVTPFVLHDRYQEWCRAYGYQSVGVNRLTERLKGLQFDQIRSGGVRLWKIRYSAPVEFYHGDEPVLPTPVSPLAANYTV